MRTILLTLLAGCPTVEPAPDPVTTSDLSARCEASTLPTCERTVELPAEYATVLEYLDPNGDVPGRCDASDQDEPPAIELPSDPDAYPVLVRIAGAGFSGTCSSCGESVPPYGFTTFGAKVDIPYAIHGRVDRAAVASVNAPWRIVTGGCGEACAHNCLSEYLEERPSTCLGQLRGGIGVATDVADPPVAELVVQLVEPDTTQGCCPLACDG